MRYFVPLTKDDVIGMPDNVATKCMGTYFDTREEAEQFIIDRKEEKVETKQESNVMTNGERFVYEWQKQMSGSFSQGLAELICKGDLQNQAWLALGYPDEVKAVQSFQTEPGWWDAVQKKTY